MGIDNRDFTGWIKRVAWVTGVLMTTAFLLAYFSTQPSRRVLFDNVQWTVAHLGAAVLAWLGYRGTVDEDHVTRRWFMWGLVCYAAGQLLWDAQIYTDWTPFPAPSDLFYAACGPCVAIGLWLALQRRVSAQRARVLLLDIIVLCIQTLAIILVVYMANTSSAPAMQLLELAVYPIVMFGSVVVGLMLAVALGLRFAWRWLLLLCALVATGIAWMCWNIVDMQGTPASGTWLNYTFAVASLLRGLGVARWDVAGAQPAVAERRDAAFFLFMPLVPVIAAVTTVFMVWDATDLPRGLRVAVMAGAAIVVMLVAIRQGYALAEREQLLRALAESEAELSAIFENSVLGIVLADERRQILRSNRAARELLGYTAEQAAQVRVEDVIHPEESALSLQLFTALTTGERDSYQQEKRYLRRDGVALWVRVTVYPVTLQTAHDFVCLIEDISQRRQTEAQLHAVQKNELRVREEFAYKLMNAQEQERQRIANELHDGLGQSLSVIRNRAQLAMGHSPAAPEVATQLQGILRVTTDAIAEVRGLAHNLRPLHIEQLGLTAALAQLLEQFAETSQVQVESRLEPIDDVIPAMQVTHIYRLLQESLNNIGKHAHAQRVKVAIERDVRAIRISIEDDGRGFDVGLATQAGGLGLNSMTERAHMLGGRAAISSSTFGSSVLIEIPIAEPNVADELPTIEPVPA